MSNSQDTPINDLTLSLGDCDTVQKDILGAAWNISRQKLPTLDREYVLIDVHINKNLIMVGVHAKATLTVEVGEKEHQHYTAKSFSYEFYGRTQWAQVQFTVFGKIVSHLKSFPFDPAALKDIQNFKATLTVESVTGPKLFNYIPVDFADPKIIHNRVVVMDDGGKISVQAELLSCWSGYFKAIFDAELPEEKAKKLLVPNVSPKDFQLLLAQLLPEASRLLDDIDGLTVLRLAHRFDIPLLVKLSLDYLCSLSIHRTQYFALEMMQVADELQLLELQDSAFHALMDVADGAAGLATYIATGVDSREFHMLPATTREKIYHALFLVAEKTDCDVSFQSE